MQYISKKKKTKDLLEDMATIKYIYIYINLPYNLSLLAYDIVILRHLDNNQTPMSSSLLDNITGRMR